MPTCPHVCPCMRGCMRDCVRDCVLETPKNSNQSMLNLVSYSATWSFFLRINSWITWHVQTGNRHVYRHLSGQVPQRISKIVVETVLMSTWHVCTHAHTQVYMFVSYSSMQLQFSTMRTDVCTDMYVGMQMNMGISTSITCVQTYV